MTSDCNFSNYSKTYTLSRTSWIFVVAVVAAAAKTDSIMDLDRNLTKWIKIKSSRVGDQAEIYLEAWLHLTCGLLMSATNIRMLEK